MLRICGNLKSAENNGVRKSKIRKSPKKLWSANRKFLICGRSTRLKKPQICDLWNLFADRPPFIFIQLIFLFLSLSIRMLFFFLYYLRFIFIFHVFLTKSVGFKYFFIRSFNTKLVFCLPIRIGSIREFSKYANIR